MGTVKTQFITDDKQAQQQLTQLVQKMNKLEAENRRLNQESKKGAQEYNSAVQDGVKDLAEMATAMIGITQLVGTAKAAYTDWRNEVEALGRSHEGFAEKFTRIIGEAGKTGDAVYFAQSIRHLQDVGISRERGLDAIAGVTAGGPALSTADQRALIEEVGRQAPVADVKALGQLSGELARRGFGGGKAGDVVDIASFIQSEAGAAGAATGGPAFVRAIDQLVGSGIDQQTALATVLATLRASNEPDAAGQIATRLADLKPVSAGRGGALSETDQIVNRIATADNPLRALLSDPEAKKALLGGEAASKIETLRFEDIETLRAGIATAQQSDLRNSRLADLTRDPLGREALELERTRADVELATRRVEREEFTANQFKDRARARATARGPLAAFAQERVFNVQDFVSAFGSQDDYAENIAAGGLATGNLQSDEVVRGLAPLGSGRLEQGAVEAINNQTKTLHQSLTVLGQSIPKQPRVVSVNEHVE